MSAFTFSRRDIWYRQLMVWKRKYLRFIGGPHITLVLLLLAFVLYRIPKNHRGSATTTIPSDRKEVQRIRKFPATPKAAIVLLAPQRHAPSMWEIDRFCFLRRAVRSIDQHLNAHYGPYPILILVAKDHAQDPERRDGAYTKRDRDLVQQWASHSIIIWHEIDMYSGAALEPDTTVAQILAWRKGKDGGTEGRSLGYQSMCRLWSGRLQNMHLLDGFDYYMRMDDDSLLTDKPEVDPFQLFEKNHNLTYVYRRKEVDHWGIQELWRVAKPYVMNPKILPSNEVTRREFLREIGEYDEQELDDTKNGQEVAATYTGAQPYNNFHISRVDFWRSQTWKSMMRDMDANHLFFQHRVGDANVHAMALMMMGDGKSEQWDNFPYAHNSNDMGMQWGTREWKAECEEQT